MRLNGNRQAPKQTNNIAKDMIVFKASKSSEKYGTAKLSYPGQVQDNMIFLHNSLK